MEALRVDEEAARALVARREGIVGRDEAEALGPVAEAALEGVEDLGIGGRGRWAAIDDLPGVGPHEDGRHVGRSLEVVTDRVDEIGYREGRADPLREIEDYAILGLVVMPFPQTAVHRLGERVPEGKKRDEGYGGQYEGGPQSYADRYDIGHEEEGECGSQRGDRIDEPLRFPVDHCSRRSTAMYRYTL